jgi:hypothetical protein
MLALIVAGVWLAACASPSQREAFRVELVEDEVAQIIYPDGRAEVVPRASLPKGAQEGDVICGGSRGSEVDAAATARGTERVRRARRALAPALTPVGPR